jgi:phage terminase small subunit
MLNNVKVSAGVVSAGVSPKTARQMGDENLSKPIIAESTTLGNAGVAEEGADFVAVAAAPIRSRQK